MILFHLVTHDDPLVFVFFITEEKEIILDIIFLTEVLKHWLCLFPCINARLL